MHQLFVCFFQSEAISIEVDYFNADLKEWEPVIEPWVFTLSVSSSFNSSIGRLVQTQGETQMESGFLISSDQTINVNVTARFATLLKQIISSG